MKRTAALLLACLAAAASVAVLSSRSTREVKPTASQTIENSHQKNKRAAAAVDRPVGGSGPMPRGNPVTSLPTSNSSPALPSDTPIDLEVARLTDPEFPSTLTAETQKQMRNEFGSIKAYQLARLRALDGATYDAWLAKRFETGLSNDRRVAQSTEIIEPLLQQAFAGAGVPESFQCSADLCVVTMSSDEVRLLLDSLGVGRVRMPETFLRNFDGQRSADGTFTTELIRADIDLSDYPDF
ncbi:MAG: hypothetical protein AAFX75_09590 [Pseudomonadota bacterium]